MKSVFVTVGTTEFNSLIKQFSDKDLLKVLKEKGYTTITLQVGKGEMTPLHYNGLNINMYRYKDSLAEDISKSDLVISHAGAGSCLEVLDAGKPLIVVVNETLMDNHQSELAEALEKRGHVLACTPETLKKTVLDLDTKNFVKYEKADPMVFVKFLNQIMGLD